MSPTTAHICSTTLSTFLSLTLHVEGRARADVLPPSARWTQRHRSTVVDPAVVYLKEADVEMGSFQPVSAWTVAQLQANVVVFLE